MVLAENLERRYQFHLDKVLTVLVYCIVNNLQHSPLENGGKAGN